MIKKLIYTISIISFFFSCKTRNNLVLKDNVKNVYICYKGVRTNEYKLNDDKIIKWDKKNLSIKNFLHENESNYNQCIKEDSTYIDDYLSNKKIMNYFPIKVIPLNEFGYILTKDNKLIYYGIMNETFIDLSHDKTYISR